MTGKRQPVSQKHETVLYALMSLACFLCGVGLLALMIWKGDQLVAWGLTGNLYYLVLLPMGLSASGFLFGVLRSYANYRGKHLGGILELGGPVVAFLLVIVCGFWLVPSAATFPLTVYIQGQGGPSDVVLRDSGYVVLDLGGDRRRQPIGAEGQAYFPAIPATFRNQEVPIWVDSDTYEVSANVKYRLAPPKVYLTVRKKPAHLSGRVQDENGNPVPAANVLLAGRSLVTDSAGHFEFVIDGGQGATDNLWLDVAKDGYLNRHLRVAVDANEVVVQLQRAP